MGETVQLEHGYTRVANQLLAAMAVAPWDSAGQLKMVTALVRMTYGARRKDAPVGMAEWRCLTGMSESQVVRVKGVLERNGVLTLVQDASPRGRTPQVWRLQKDWKKWGRFRPLDAAVCEAEAVVGQSLPTHPTASMRGDSTAGGGQGCGGVAEMTGDPPAGMTGDPPASMRGGTGSKPLSPNASGPPKERERKERNTPPVVPPTPALQELERFLGEGALVTDLVALGEHPDLLARGFLGLYGPNGTEELLRKRAGPRWATVLRTAVQRFVAEGRPYHGRYFRRFVVTALDERDEDHGPRSPSFGDETARDAERMAQARSRAAARRTEEAEAAARDQRALESAAAAWYQELSGDELEEVREDVEGRVQLMVLGGVRRSAVMERMAVVEVFRARGTNGKRPTTAARGATA